MDISGLRDKGNAWLRAFVCAVMVLATGPAALAGQSAPDMVISAWPGAVTQGDPLVVVVRAKSGWRSVTATFNGEGRDIPLAPCGGGEPEGCYVGIAGIGVFEKPGIHRITVKRGGREFYHSIVVRPGAFGSQRLTVDPRTIYLSPADQERADRETAMLEAIWAKTTPRAWEGAFASPLDNEVTTEFGVRRVYNGSRRGIHRGLDISGRLGEPVHAANAGTVVFAGDTFYGGNTVVLDHGMGIYTIYMHMSELKTAVGRKAARGDVLGLVGSTGRSTGPHLHFGVKVGAMSTSPKGIIALPLDQPLDLSKPEVPAPKPKPVSKQKRPPARTKGKR